MKLKPAASLVGVQWQMFDAAIKIEPLFHAVGSDCVITSGTDGKHKPNGLHHVGMALDFRTRDLSPSDCHRVAGSCSAVLGRDYDVVLEVDHIHIEFQPKE